MVARQIYWEKGQLFALLKDFSHLEISICMYHIHLQSNLPEIMRLPSYSAEKMSRLENQIHYVQDQRGPSTLISPLKTPFPKHHLLLYK